MHYIIYHDKSVELIEDKEAQILWDESCAGNKGVEINGKKYIFSSFAKILNENDYFAQYPEKAPAERNEFVVPRSEYVSIEKMAEKRQGAFRGILKGLKQYIDEQLADGVTPKNAIAIYEQKLERYKQLFGN